MVMFDGFSLVRRRGRVRLDGEPPYWETANGGAKRIVSFLGGGGGKTYHRVCPPKLAQKVGLVWSVNVLAKIFPQKLVMTKII